MTRVVIDASAALAWLLASQATTVAHIFLGESDDRDFVAPFIFEWEVKNVLVGLERSGRISVQDQAALLAQLDAYGIRLAEPTAVGAILPLARQERLSLFDAAYLAISIDHGAPLASRDKPLLAAASRQGLEVFDLSDATQ